MNHRVRLSQRARRDIEEAYLYIRRDAPLRATQWRSKLRQAVRSLKVFPKRHAVLFDEATAGRTIRQMTFGTYLVLYSVDDQVVNVLTIRHSARRPMEPGEL